MARSHLTLAALAASAVPELDAVAVSSFGSGTVGDFDVVKEVLEAEGQIVFWRVRMKPGKPLAFGRIDDVPVVGLPGNPVSAMVSFETFVRPAILKMRGLTPPFH